MSESQSSRFGPMLAHRSPNSAQQSPPNSNAETARNTITNRCGPLSHTTPLSSQRFTGWYSAIRTFEDVSDMINDITIEKQDNCAGYRTYFTSDQVRQLYAGWGSEVRDHKRRLAVTRKPGRLPTIAVQRVRNGLNEVGLEFYKRALMASLNLCFLETTMTPLAGWHAHSLPASTPSSSFLQHSSASRTFKLSRAKSYLLMLFDLRQRRQNDQQSWKW